MTTPTTKTAVRPSWTPGDTPPALRRALSPPRGFQFDAVRDGPTCPYCGANSLIRSYSDQADDDLRIDAYCTNTHCTAREIVVLAWTSGYAGRRADLEALRAVDHGPQTERNQGGFCTWNGASLWSDREERSQAVVRRRRGELVPCDCDECSGRRRATALPDGDHE